jgi:hypothetical protein
MTSRSLVTVHIHTKFGIDFYCAKVVENARAYVDTLREAGDASITLEYKYDETEEMDMFGISDIAEAMEIHSPEKTEMFMGVYGDEFNSSENYKIFDYIDASYIMEYGCAVSSSDNCGLYSNLYKILSEREDKLLKEYKSSDDTRRQKITDAGLLTKMRECRDILDSYRDKGATDRMERATRAVITSLQSIPVTPPTPTPKHTPIATPTPIAISTPVATLVNPPPASEKSQITVKKNQHGQYVYEKYNLVIDPNSKVIVGRPNGMGGTIPLDISMVELCKKLNLKYRID